MWRNGSIQAAVSYYQYMKQHKKSIVFFCVPVQSTGFFKANNERGECLHNGIQLLTKVTQKSIKKDK
jgi:hypothetical protein